MRWEGQGVDADDADALPGLGQVRGVLRTVSPKEMPGVRFHEVAARSALNEVPGSSAMPFRWTINPYRGCSHGCVYCYARGTHSWLELDTGSGFDREIVVKVNVAEVLQREVSRPTWCREHVALGTNTDPYQRAEGRYALMPGIIRALAGAGTPFSILTKGTLLRRDIPLLTSAARDVPLGLGVSLAIHDDALHATLEPGTPSPKARLALVRALRDAGLPCGVMLAPVIPWLTDSTEHLDRALAALADAGATGVTALALHLRPGAREWFFTWLARERPDLVKRYEALYAHGVNPPGSYRRALAARIAPLLEKHGFGPERKAAIRADDEAGFPEGSLPTLDAQRPDVPADQLSLL
jgi:DNA repair photolyase